MINRAFILRIISIAMVAALAIVIIVFMTKTSGSKKSIDEVKPAVVAVFENDKSEESPERMFKKSFGLNAAEYDGVVLFSPKSNMDAEELLIVKLASEKQAEELLESIENRVTSRMNVFDGYAPDQYDLCKKAVIDHQGNYVLYVVHENADSVDAAFKQALK